MWIPGEQDESMGRQVIELADSCDTILLGRKMTREFINHWENVVDRPDVQKHSLDQRMVNMRKIVFSRTLTAINGRNLEVENGDLDAAVKALKKEPGKYIIVYAGDNFVSSLISQNLIDDYFIFRNPVAIWNGLNVLSRE
jgi:dihydrofolate reductase